MISVPAIRRVLGRCELGWLLLPLALVLAHPAGASGMAPASGHFTGGLAVKTFLWYFEPLEYYGYDVKVYFGDTASPEVWYTFFIGEYQLNCTVPPGVPGTTVDVTVKYEHPTQSRRPDVLPQAFTYLAAPVIHSIDPPEHSYRGDKRRCAIFGRGFVFTPGTQVYFGGVPATEVTVTQDSPDENITCMPPPFPGGAWPLKVDVVVKNPTGDSFTLEDGFSYTQIVPRFTYVSGGRIPAWQAGWAGVIYPTYLTEGLVYSYVDNLFVGSHPVNGETGQSVTGFLIPPHPPGFASVTVVGGDGGRFTLEKAIEFYGPELSDFHTADRDQDFRLNLSEVLRIVQFYAVGGFHCDETSEDGYAPGAGDTACAPHAADNAPQDWRIGLEEILAIIQLYNSLCYRPCEGAPGTYCPPIDIRDGWKVSDDTTSLLFD